MSAGWAIVIARDDASAVAGLRLQSDVEISENGKDLWLRGREANEVLALQLRGLPARVRYQWLDGHQLRRLGARIPAEAFPPLSWRPLQDYVEIALPPAGFPAEMPRPVPLQLVHSAEERTANLLLAALVEWAEFVQTAPRVRLDPLTFAASDGGNVLVRGHPLPPLRGRRFVLEAGIAIPAGYEWAPRVSIEVVARCFRTTAEQVIVWHEDGTFSRVPGELFVSVTRAGVRATAQTAEVPS